jgi:hypothetical protein
MAEGDKSETLGDAEESAREAYHGGKSAPPGRSLGRKDPEVGEEGERDEANVPQR